MQNPFVYGEVVPVEAFVDREAELERLVEDLVGRPEGLPHLAAPLRQVVAGAAGADRAATRRGALTVEVTVSSYSSYLSFLEGYARALAGVETRWERARNWLTTVITSTRPEVRYEPGITGSGRLAVSFPMVHSERDVNRLANEVFALPGQLADRTEAHRHRGARRVPGHRRLQRRQRRARAARGRAASTHASATSSPDRSRA